MHIFSRLCVVSYDPLLHWTNTRIGLRLRAHTNDTSAYLASTVGPKGRYQQIVFTCEIMCSCLLRRLGHREHHGHTYAFSSEMESDSVRLAASAIGRMSDESRSLYNSMFDSMWYAAIGIFARRMRNTCVTAKTHTRQPINNDNNGRTSRPRDHCEKINRHNE